MLGLTFAAVATASTFDLNITGKTSLPSYTGDADIHGSVELLFNGTKVQVKYNLTNLPNATCTEAQNACGIHIHRGTNCDDPQGHFWINSTTLPTDPWAFIAYSNDTTTSSQGESPSFEVGFNANEAAGHVFIVHDKDGKKAACTVILKSGWTGIPQPENGDAIKFFHSEEQSVKIGVTGEAYIVGVSIKDTDVRTTLRVRSPSPAKLDLENSQYFFRTTGNYFFARASLNITKEAVSPAGNPVWSLYFNAATEDRAKLTVEVLQNDCRVAAEESEAAETTDKHELCVAGSTCDEKLKSCQEDRKDLHVDGRVRSDKDSSDAAQSSSHAILFAMVAYILV
eukprot:GEMP01050548.1.p1 GENE.GEMP01050548.1~~GEMP01050548.1.p1  ORF type:complete len:340 (+),score=68.10 GEMP01050548.1:44-1063(+)